ncbi:hypothetical protein BDW62DRAFT_191365 [Aspergillus aurantiobrunneus]
MAPPKSGSSRKLFKGTHSREGKKSDKKSNAPTPGRNGSDQPKRQNDSNTENQDSGQIEISATIPITLQQLLLNVFKAALLPSNLSDSQDPDAGESLNIKSLIQTIKSHLYNRDFDSAFADADEKLLRAYALRWSAARALGYAGLFRSLLKALVEGNASDSGDSSTSHPLHVVCIGGGAGAEIVALAAAWRDLVDEGTVPRTQPELSDVLEAVSLEDRHDSQGDGSSSDSPSQEQVVLQSGPSPNLLSSLSITAVDIADWSTVVKRLSSTILSASVPGSKSHSAPLFPAYPQPTTTESIFNVDFKHLDVLSLSDPDLTSLFHTTQSSPNHTKLVTLMFTLNELFSTSMPKATSFLLQTTDLLQPGTILLVVDSPGSYSTLKLGKGAGTQEKQYPMKFLLDHTLLSVATGKWEKVISQDSRWWRRDAARLWYDVGEGAGLEDMRFQIHVYRRLGR